MEFCKNQERSVLAKLNARLAPFAGEVSEFRIGISHNIQLCTNSFRILECANRFGKKQGRARFDDRLTALFERSGSNAARMEALNYEMGY